MIAAAKVYDEKARRAMRSKLPKDDWLFLEECRPMIVRALVYDGLSATSTADLFGLLPSALLGVLKLWEVRVPVYITQTEHRIWFRRKTEIGNSLPKPLRMINRSDLHSIWKAWDMDSVCVIWGVGSGTMEAALEFHCILPPLSDKSVAAVLCGSPCRRRSAPLHEKDSISPENTRCIEQGKCFHLGCGGNTSALNNCRLSSLL